MIEQALVQTQQQLLSARASFVRRLVPGVYKRLRVLYLRCRYSEAQFSSKCDIRKRFTLRQGKGATVFFGEACIIDNDMTIECMGNLMVGDNTIFGHHCTVAARENVTIGENCMIAEMVSIRDHNHCFARSDVLIREQGMVCRPVSIGNNVWIGCKVTVAMGVNIGDNAVIGANAVVTKDIPANAIAVGIPARVIRMRGES